MGKAVANSGQKKAAPSFSVRSGWAQPEEWVIKRSKPYHGANKRKSCAGNEEDAAQPGKRNV